MQMYNSVYTFHDMRECTGLYLEAHKCAIGSQWVSNV